MLIFPQLSGLCATIKVIMEEIFRDGAQSVYVRGDIIPVDERINFIKSGAVALYSCEPDTKNFLFAYKKNEIFPYIQNKSSQLSGRDLEYRALSTVTVLSIPRQKFEAEAFKPQNIKRFVSELMEIMEFQIERIENLEQGQVYQRLLGRLNFFARRLGVEHGDKIIIDAPLSHGDIATSIGTTRETVNRLMKRLEKAGVITVKKQTIIINSLNQLNQIITQESKRQPHKGFLLVASLSALVAEGAVSFLPGG